MVFSRDNRWLLSCGNDQVACLWDTTTWRGVAQYRGPRLTARDVAMSTDSRLVAVSWQGGPCIVYDRLTVAPLMQVKGGYQLLMPDHGQTLMVMSHDRLRFWNLVSQREAGSVTFQDHTTHFLTLSPDGSVAATITLNGALHLFRAALPESIPGR